MSNYGFETTGDEIVAASADEVRGRTFLITGPSPQGVGAETAISLAKAKPGLIILAGRSESKIQPVVEEIRQTGVSVQYLPLDLSSQKSVRAAVEILRHQNTVIDVLINNGAVMACPWGTTEEGIETQFGTNHIGHFLFTNLLLKSNLVRLTIVNVSSSASVRKASYLVPHFEDVTYNNGEHYDPGVAYCVSKLAMVLYSRQLADKLASRNIRAFSLNPGSIKSPLQRYLSPEMRQQAIAKAKETSYNFQMPVPKSLQQGCSTQLRAALDPGLANKSGSYLDNCQVVEFREHIEAYPVADRVWRLSEELTGEVFDF